MTRSLCCCFSPEVYQWGPLGSTQTQTWDDIKIWTSQDRLCHYSRYCSLGHAGGCSLPSYPCISYMAFYSECRVWNKCALDFHLLVVMALFSSSDQTPTPTRFLKNCEEVGLFNELASSFDQDDDEKRAKNSVRKLGGWGDNIVFISIFECMNVFRNQGSFLLLLYRWDFSYFPLFLPKVLI